MTPFTRPLKFYVLITPSCKTKQLRNLVRGILGSFEWVEMPKKWTEVLKRKIDLNSQGKISWNVSNFSCFFSNNVVLHPEFLSRSGSHVLLDVWQTPLFKFFINYSVCEKRKVISRIFEKRGVSCPVRTIQGHVICSYFICGSMIWRL